MKMRFLPRFNWIEIPGFSITFEWGKYSVLQQACQPHGINKLQTIQGTCLCTEEFDFIIHRVWKITVIVFFSTMYYHTRW